MFLYQRGKKKNSRIACIEKKIDPISIGQRGVVKIIVYGVVFSGVGWNVVVYWSVPVLCLMADSNRTFTSLFGRHLFTCMILYEYAHIEAKRSKAKQNVKSSRLFTLCQATVHLQCL